MDGFKTIRFRVATARRYKDFSRKFSKSYSDTLEKIMDFFEWHGINPSQRFTKSIIEEILKNRERTETSIKRNEATIAIIRDIELSQTKPTTAILQSLLGKKSKEESPVKVEKKFIKIPQEEESTVPNRYERLHSKFNSVKKDFGYVLENIKEVKNNFGKTISK